MGGLRGRGGWGRAALRALCLALLAGGCSAPVVGDRGPTPPATEPATEPDGSETARNPLDRSREFPAQVRVEGTGAAAFTWEGTQTVVLNRLGGLGLRTNLLSAGFLNPEPLPEDRSLRFRWGFDLMGVYADEPGTFTYDGKDGPTAGSNLVFVWMKVKDPAKSAVFEEDEVEFLKYFTVLRQPCTVEVGEGERTGTLRCPEVATEDGETAGLTVAWQEVS